MTDSVLYALITNNTVALITPEAHTVLLTHVSHGKGLIQTSASLVNYINIDSCGLANKNSCISSVGRCWGPAAAGRGLLPLPMSLLKWTKWGHAHFHFLSWQMPACGEHRWTMVAHLPWLRPPQIHTVFKFASCFYITKSGVSAGLTCDAVNHLPLSRHRRDAAL